MASTFKLNLPKREELMKKKNVQFIIFLTFIVFFANQGRTEDWIIYSNSPTGDIYYHKSSIQKIEKNIIYVQTKKIYNENGRIKIFEFLNEINEAPENSDILHYDLMMQKINCYNLTRSDSRLRIFDERDNLLYSDDTAGKWKKIIPDTATDKLKNIVCRVERDSPLSQEKLHALSDASSIRQRDFERIKRIHPDLKEYGDDGSIIDGIKDQPQQSAAEQAVKEIKRLKGIVLTSGEMIDGQIIFMSADTVKIRTKDGKLSSYSFTEQIQDFIRE